MDCSEPTSPGADPGNQTPRRRLTEKKRRLVTNNLFDELVVVLSLIRGHECENPRKLDKVSILQQTRNMVKFFHDLGAQDKNSKAISSKVSIDATRKLPFLKTGALFELFMDSLNGFVLVVMSSGRIVHASANTICTLGCRPSAVIGQHTSSWMYQEDAMRILRPQPPSDPLKPAIAPRFPCRFNVQGAHESTASSDRSSPSAQFVVYKCSVYNRDCTVEDPDGDEGADFPSDKLKHDFCKVVVASTRSLAYRDAPIPMDESEFCFELRITREGKILSISSHSALALGHTEAEIIGSSIFDYVYPYHVTAFGQSIVLFLQNGYGATNPYRILTKGGQWVWCVTRGFIGCNPWSNAPDHILLHMKVIGTDRVNPQQREWANFTYLPDNSIFQKANFEKESSQHATANLSQLPHSPVQTGSKDQFLTVNPPSRVVSPPVTPQSSSTSLPPQATAPLPSSLKPRAQKPTAPKATPEPSNTSGSPTTFAAENKMADRVKMLEKELSSKNAALYESQTRLLEQQSLLGHERKRFFELTETLVRQYNVFQDYQQHQQPQKYNFPPNSGHQTPKWSHQQYSPVSAPPQSYAPATEMESYPPTSVDAYRPMNSGPVDEFFKGETTPEAKDHAPSDSVANMLAKLIPDGNLYRDSFPAECSLESQSDLLNPYDTKNSMPPF